MSHNYLNFRVLKECNNLRQAFPFNRESNGSTCVLIIHHPLFGRKHFQVLTFYHPTQGPPTLLSHLLSKVQHNYASCYYWIVLKGERKLREREEEEQ